MNKLQYWWSYSEKPTARLVVALLISTVIHGALLLIQFGEYGEGLPGFELPDMSRRAQTPEIHFNLQNAVPRIHEDTPITQAAKENAPAQPSRSKLDSQAVFELVPMPVSVPVTIAKAKSKPVESVVTTTPKPIKPVIRPIRPHRADPKIITTPLETESTFKVASAEQAITEPKIADQIPPDQVSSVVAPNEEKPVEIKPAETTTDEDKAAKEREDAEKQAAEKLAAKMLEEKQAAEMQAQEQDRQRQLAAKAAAEAAVEAAVEAAAAAREAQRQKQLEEQRQADLKAAHELEEQRQAQVAAQLAAQRLQQEQLSKLNEQEQAEREKAAAAKAAFEEEKRKLAEAVRQEQAKKDQEQREKEKLEQQRREQLDRELAEKMRLEDLKLKQAQIAEQQAAQAKALQHENELRQAASQQILQAQNTQQKELIAKTKEKASNNDLGDGLGAPAKSVQGMGGSKVDMDKLMSGRTYDYDKSGDAVKSANPTDPAPSPLPEPTISSNVRRSIFGSRNTDVGLNLYIQSWRQKIERNGRLNFSQLSKSHMHTDPLVVVSVRSDGSVENVVILRSSGRAEMDEAVRHIALLNAPYSPFPPNLARRFDVIDIRQIWIFDEDLKVMDEMR